ncbi:hypothetical protein JT358_10170 [Micrococcales bacterium 31B]|nr:hypothetical protein [Micrococcales bacterium 31B]
MDATLRKATIYGRDFTFEARLILNAATNLSDTFVEVPKARELVNYVVDWAKNVKEADFMPTLDELDPAIVLLEENAISMVSDEDRISQPREQEWITACRDELNSLYRDPERMGQAYDDLVSKKMITVRATDAKEVGGERSQGFALRFAEVSKYQFGKRMRNTSLEPVIEACSKKHEIIEDSAPLQDEPRDVATSPDDASDGESGVGAPSPDFTYSQSGRVELYVGVESGRLTGATIESETDTEKTTVSVEFGRDQVEVKKPSPSISLEDLISSVTER